MKLHDGGGVYFTVGDITFKLQARDCMDPPQTISGPKCYDDNDEVIGVSISFGIHFSRETFWRNMCSIFTARTRMREGNVLHLSVHGGEGGRCTPWSCPGGTLYGTNGNPSPPPDRTRGTSPGQDQGLVRYVADGITQEDFLVDSYVSGQSELKL